MHKKVMNKKKRKDLEVIVVEWKETIKRPLLYWSQGKPNIVGQVVINLALAILSYLLDQFDFILGVPEVRGIPCVFAEERVSAFITTVV
jgi:hypothetical protein